jgi:hypothetical protein
MPCVETQDGVHLAYRDQGRMTVGSVMRVVDALRASRCHASAGQRHPPGTACRARRAA